MTADDAGGAPGSFRTVTADSVGGTALYDAVVAGSNALATESLPARVLILLTDGSNAPTEATGATEATAGATLEEAIQAANAAGVSVYAIGIEGPQFSPEAVKQIAAETNGQYYGAASAAALRSRKKSPASPRGTSSHGPMKRMRRIDPVSYA